MSLSLSQLFEQHKSQNSPKQEEENRSDGIVDSSIQRSLFDSEHNVVTERASANVTTRKKSRKRTRPPSPSNSDNQASDTEEPTTQVKEGYSNDVKSENNVETEQTMEDVENEEEFDEDDNVDDNVDRASNQRFYQNYSESVQVLYNSSQRDEPQSVLQVVNSALHPTNQKSGNERRLPDQDFPSRSLAGRYRPRKRRVVTKLSSRKREISYRLETQEEIRDRVQRMQEYEERAQVRARWKQRKVNFQSEDDIGDAFLRRAQETIGEKLRSDEKDRRRKQKKERKEGLKRQRKEELKRIQQMERDDRLEEDDEVKEQSQLLAQLSQPEIMLKEEDLDDPENNPQEEAKKLNYWELGYAMPNKSSITFDFDPSVEKMVQSGSKEALETIKKDSKDNVGETKASFSALMTKQDGPRNSSRYFFEPNRALISNAKGTFRPGYRSGHIHHLLSMAARSLCGDGGSRSLEDIELENHYMRLLCKQHQDESKKKRHFDATICADFRKKGFLTELAEEQGKNMLLYVKNAWDDPAKVATQLGITNCFEESPIRGNLLTNIKTHSKKKRLQIKKLHRLHSVDWDHENHNEDESDHEDEEMTMSLDGKIVPEVTTHGGVVDAMTMETSMTIDRKRHFGTSIDDRDAFIKPNTFYSHIAGTSPPIPQHPLDPSAWLFGPVDRFSKFYHTSVRMDSSIYKIVLSTLVKRIGRAKILKRQSIARNTQDQITNLIEEFANVNENKLYLQYTNTVQDPSDSDIPLVEFYRGLTGYCTYMANGFLETQQDGNKQGDEVIDLRKEQEESQPSSGVNFVAGKIWEFCHPKIRQNALLRFPKLRITFGIALICRSINPSAAEILSSSIDDDSFRTPLDLFKEALEDMESKKYISTNRNLEDNSIPAVELEFLLHDAAEFFQEAVELDPTNVEYQLWHIGCLASCLLISSGNKICAKSAHVHPSQMKGTFLDSAKCAHEVRPCMKKYNEVRVELSTAVKALFTLVKYQDSSRAHLGLFSFLEWAQVMGLLVGSQLSNSLTDIRKRHDWHFGSWARHEPATFLRECRGMAEKICVASLYAQILENDPGKIANWRNFVQCLGPVPDAKSDDWWGRDRSWWADSLLNTTSTNACDLKKIGGLVEKNVLGQLKLAIASSSAAARSSSAAIKLQETTETLTDDIGWLPTLDIVTVKNEEEVKISEEERTRCYANELPKTQKNIPDDDSDGPASAFSFSIPSSNPPLRELSMSHEIEAYKTFISCHMFGVDQPSVTDYIIFNLCNNCINDENDEMIDENCDEFRVLVWLNSMGIDVEDIIHGIESEEY